MLYLLSYFAVVWWQSLIPDPSAESLSGRCPY